MTNKYLEKIAARLEHQPSAAKTFAQSSVAGWAGHVAGAAAGGVGLGLLAAKNKTVGRLARKTLVNTKLMGRSISRTPPGRFIKKHFTGGGAAGVVGGVVGGIAGEEAGNYAAIKHNVAKDKDK